MAAMNWHKLVWWDNTNEFPFVSDSDNLQGLDEWNFLSASPVSNWSDEVWFQCTDPEYDGDPDDVLANHLGIPIYSPRLRQALDRAGITGIQYLPVRVLHRDGSAIPGYHIANFTNQVKALDLQRSKYRVFEDDYFIVRDRGQIANVDMAVLKKGAVFSFDVFRLEEFLPYEVASERFKCAFEEACCTGYSFQKLALS